MAEASTIDSGTPTNGKSPKGWTNWPSTFKAARILKLKVPQVRILVQTGDLPVFEAPDGTQRFDPVVLKELVAEVSHLTDEDFDTSIATRKLEEQRLDAQAERDGMPVEAVRQHAEFVRTILNHNRELHTIVMAMHEDGRKTVNASATVNDAVIKRLQEQLSHYHKMFDEMVHAREVAATQQTERELVLLQENDKITRRQQVLGIAKEQAGKLVSIVAAKLGVDESLLQNFAGKVDAQKVTAALEFFQSLESDQVDVAMASGFFTPKQVQWLSTITGRNAPQSTTESESPCESPQAENPSPTPNTP